MCSFYIQWPKIEIRDDDLSNRVECQRLERSRDGGTTVASSSWSKTYQNPSSH